MKCPVCKAELSDGVTKCSSCGFSELYREFLNMDEAVNWMEQMVLPYRERWKQRTSVDSAENLYEEIMRKRMEMLTTSVQPSGKEFEYEISNGGITLTKYNDTRQSVEVPASIDGYPVVGLGKRLFYGCRELRHVILPNTIQRIEDMAFCESGLCNINIPGSCTHIGEVAFARSELQEIDLPETCSFVGRGAFQSTKIREIVFPSSIKVIASGVCSGCSDLKTAVILGAETIENAAFAYCDALEKIALPLEMDSIESPFSDLLSHGCSLSGPDYLLLPNKLNRLVGYFGKSGCRHIAFPDQTTSIEKWDSYNRGHCILYCMNGSTAQQYAREHGVKYKPLNEFPAE